MLLLIVIYLWRVDFTRQNKCKNYVKYKNINRVIIEF